MMKKRLVIIISFCILLIGVLNPVIVNAETLADKKSELATLKQKKANQESSASKTQAEIDANKTKVSETEEELESAKSEIESLQEQIESTEKEIASLKESTSSVLLLYQQLDSENIYLSYITGASSMTELVMRIDVITQLTEYNQQKITELELLISTNEKLSAQLEEYQEGLNDKILAYEEAIDELGDELAEYEEGALTIQEQIDVLQTEIEYYEDLGCEDDEELASCLSYTNNTGWLKPVSKGRITSLYGYRTSPTASASSYHRGIDIGVSEGTEVYGTANGTVAAIVRKSSCGGNMVYIYTYVDGKPYTYVFMHMLEIYVSVGDTVTVNTVVGLSGGKTTSVSYGGYDKCTTGAHLHYGVAEGHYVSSFNSHTINPPGYPGLYQWFYSRY